MKKIIITVIASVFVLVSYAQKDVTTFLGIPVDGYRAEMRQKLIAKGYTPNKANGQEYFEGEFNGQDVNIFIGTNNNKVYRLMICDANYTNEANIKLRFNNLVRQFENNERYDSFIKKQTLDEDVDISYEMSGGNKTFDAYFYQKIDTTSNDFAQHIEQLVEEFKKDYSEEQIANASEEEKEEMASTFLRKTLDLATKKLVWFRISEYLGEYCITMYYDNEYNKANGEDL